MAIKYILISCLLLIIAQTTLLAQQNSQKDNVKACLESLEIIPPAELYVKAKKCLRLAIDYDLSEKTLLSGSYFFRTHFIVFAIETRYDIEKITSELKKYYPSKLAQFIDFNSVKYESTETLNEAYEELWTYDWYTLSDSTLRLSHLITSELKNRNENIKIKGADLFYRYNTHRLFKLAKKVKDEFKLIDIPTLPAVIYKNKYFSEKLPAIYKVNTKKKELHLINFDLDHFTGLIIATLNNCPEANVSAMQIEKSPELLKAFREHAVWLEDQVEINFDKISNWNLKYPWAPLQAIYRRKYWPIKTRIVPTFYFYKDGKVIASMDGFDSAHILENFKKIGIKF